MNKYEYTVTSTNHSKAVASPEGFTPKLPEGDNWTLVSSSATDVRLFWTWRQKASDQYQKANTIVQKLQALSRYFGTQNEYYHARMAIKAILSQGYTEQEAETAIRVLAASIKNGTPNLNAVDRVTESLLKGNYKTYPRVGAPESREDTQGLREVEIQASEDKESLPHGDYKKDNQRPSFCPVYVSTEPQEPNLKTPSTTTRDQAIRGSLYTFAQNLGDPERAEYHRNRALKVLLSEGYAEDEAQRTLKTVEYRVALGDTCMDIANTVVWNLNRGYYKSPGDMKTLMPFKNSDLRECLYAFARTLETPGKKEWSAEIFKLVQAQGYLESEAQELTRDFEGLIRKGNLPILATDAVLERLTHGDYNTEDHHYNLYHCLTTFLAGEKEQDRNSKVLLNKLITMGCSEAEARRAILALTQYVTQGGCTNEEAATHVAKGLSKGVYKTPVALDPKQETSTAPTDLTMGCSVPYEPYNECSHTKAVDVVSEKPQEKGSRKDPTPDPDEAPTLQASFGANPTGEAVKELKEAVALSDQTRVDYENQELQTFFKALSAKGYSEEDAFRAVKALVNLIEIGYPADQAGNAVQVLLKKDETPAAF